MKKSNSFLTLAIEINSKVIFSEISCELIMVSYFNAAPEPSNINWLDLNSNPNRRLY